MKRLKLITITLLFISLLLAGCTNDSNSDTEMIDNDNENQEEIEPILPEQKNIALLGAETYAEITGSSDNFTDEVEEGKEFLAIYLEIKNHTLESDYFHYDLISSEVDGSEVETTNLMNNPKGYKPMFTELPAENTVKGYLAYEVSEEWESLKLTYTGWSTEEDEMITLNITKEDIKEVEELEEAEE